MAFFLFSCGGEDCSESEWVGTYTLVGEGFCDLGDGATVQAQPTIVIVAGSSDDEIIVDGQTGTIDEDDCRATVLFTVLEKGGDQIMIDFGGDCEIVFER